jgi:hemerythrin superfamily protein
VSDADPGDPENYFIPGLPELQQAAYDELAQDLQDSLSPEQAIEDELHAFRVCVPTILDDGSHTQRMELVKATRLLRALAEQIREEVINSNDRS